VTLEPRPDYWASVLFKRLMGTRVLNVVGTNSPETLRMYAHCGVDGEVSVLLIHLDRSQPITVGVAGWEAETVDLWQLTAEGPEATEVRLDGATLIADAQGRLPEMAPIDAWGGEALLPPLSITFIQGPALQGGVCDGAP
jgi:heparanase 1